MHKTQLQRCIVKIKRDGYITRNECLDLPFALKITRLSDIIFRIKKLGYDFKTEEKNSDTIYICIQKPPQEKWEYIEKNGERLAVKVLEEPKNLNLL